MVDDLFAKGDKSGSNQAQFNMSYGLTVNLWRLCYMADEFYFNRNYPAWCHALMNLHKNIYPFMSDKEIEVADNYKNKIYSRMLIVQKRMQTLRTTTIENSLVVDLFNWDCFLRKLMQKHGLYMPTKATSVDATKNVD